jgi:hypothetical protein
LPHGQKARYSVLIFNAGRQSPLAWLALFALQSIHRGPSGRALGKRLGQVRYFDRDRR